MQPSDALKSASVKLAPYSSSRHDRMDPSETIFQSKYTEFIADLKETFPELATELAAAEAIPAEKRRDQYIKHVLKTHAKPDTILLTPGTVLPGVTISNDLWSCVSSKTCKAIYDYLSLLDLCSAYDNKSGLGKEWAEKIMGDWKEKLSGVDFASLSEKFASMFGGEGAAGAIPQLPERFLKGKLAKLAEEMVREFRPEDFGFTAEEVAEIESDPKRGFEKLMSSAMSNPGKLQETMMRVAKRLQERIQRGELKPAELAAEAEELMKDFQSQPAFTQMMEQFRSAFSFEDPVAARAAGYENEGRLAAVRARLRKKLAAKQAKK